MVHVKRGGWNGWQTFLLPKGVQPLDRESLARTIEVPYVADIWDSCPVKRQDRKINGTIIVASEFLLETRPGQES